MFENALFGGVNTAVLTPMNDDLSVNADKMAARCTWLLANGVDNLAILGTTGEANSIGLLERMALMENLISRGVPAARLLPGVGTPAITDTVMQIRRAAELGIRGVLVLPPFFYKNPSDDGLFAYFSEVINRAGTGTPIFLYHFPAQSAVPFSLDLIARLLKAFPGTVKGLKDSTGDFSQTKAFADNFAADGFEVYCGDDGALHDLLIINGAGCITAASNVTSAVNARVYAARGTQAAADEQVVLTAMRRAITSFPLIPGLKSLVARHTGDESWTNIRPPHLKLAPEVADRLFAAFDSCGFTLAQAA
jgi:4-hydroxy-tetrahydrodipicolinate synthase